MASILGLALAACSNLATTPSTAATTSLTPSITLSPAATATQTPTATLSMSLTPVPTLTYDKRVSLLETLIETNGGCELPCWWGAIKPGETTIEERNTFFESIGMPLDFSGAYPNLYVPVGNSVNSVDYVVADYLVQVRVDTQEGIVKRVELQGDDEPAVESARFEQVWDKYYRWDRILTKFGNPTQVFVALRQDHLEITPPPEYLLYLYYESLGAMILYRGQAETLSDSRIRACPRFDHVYKIRLTLEATNFTTTLIEDFALPSDAKSLESLTGMTKEAFYAAFKDPNSETCFEQLASPN